MSSSRRSRWFAIPLLALVGALLLPAAASAAKEAFYRFEVERTANYTLTEDCPEGSTAQIRVTVIAGHEEESEEDATTLDRKFLTVLIRGFDCDFNLINDRGSGPAEFMFSSGLERASVTGTIATEAGRIVTADIAWEGTGGLEVTNNVTTFPGFNGHFQGMEREAVATGTVVVDGETLIDGSTTNARIESLEDTNTTTSE